MKNKIEELATIIHMVDEELMLKKKKLVDADTFNAHSQGRVKNVKKRIKALELDSIEIKERYSSNPDVFVNFKKRASQIMKVIEELT